jgi:hypothetical protein
MCTFLLILSTLNKIHLLYLLFYKFEWWLSIFLSGPLCLWLPFTSITVISVLRVIKSSVISVAHPGSVKLERTVRIIPLMRLFEERIIEWWTFRNRRIVILIWKPTVPLGWYHITIGTSHRKKVIILYPTTLVAV